MEMQNLSPSEQYLISTLRKAYGRARKERTDQTLILKVVRPGILQIMIAIPEKAHAAKELDY